jgi:hypothetical protein
MVRVVTNNSNIRNVMHMHMQWFVVVDIDYVQMVYLVMKVIKCICF